MPLDIPISLRKDISTSSSIEQLDFTRQMLNKIKCAYPEMDISLPISIITEIIRGKTESAYYLFWCEDNWPEGQMHDGYMLYQNIDGKQLTPILPEKGSHWSNTEFNKMLAFLEANNISSVLTGNSGDFSFEDGHQHSHFDITPIQDGESGEILRAGIKVEVVNVLK